MLGTYPISQRLGDEELGFPAQGVPWLQMTVRHLFQLLFLSSKGVVKNQELNKATLVPVSF